MIKLDSEVINYMFGIKTPDGQILYLEIKNIFKQDAHQFVQGMFQSLESKDFEQLEHLAHTLKSTSQSVGARDLGQLCDHIESLCHEKKPPQELVSSMDQLRPLLEQTLQALSQLEEEMGV